MNPVPGWYPDPAGEYDNRWWDGRCWTEQVSTGRFTGHSPVHPTPVPELESELWVGPDGSMTTHRVWVKEGSGAVMLAWWMVQHAEVRGSDVVLIIDYPGYTDRRERRLRRVGNPDELAAVALVWARRHRRRSGSA